MVLEGDDAGFSAPPSDSPTRKQQVAAFVQGVLGFAPEG
jgi:hypothetical protein